MSVIPHEEGWKRRMTREAGGLFRPVCHLSSAVRRHHAAHSHSYNDSGVPLEPDFVGWDSPGTKARYQYRPVSGSCTRLLSRYAVPGTSVTNGGFSLASPAKTIHDSNQDLVPFWIIPRRYHTTVKPWMITSTGIAAVKPLIPVIDRRSVAEAGYKLTPCGHGVAHLPTPNPVSARFCSLQQHPPPPLAMRQVTGSDDLRVQMRWRDPRCTLYRSSSP
jgi:hypothetical protein